MFRWIALLSVLIGFLFVQVAPTLGMSSLRSASAEKSFSAVTAAGQQSKEDADGSPTTADNSSTNAEEEESSDSSKVDGSKFLVSQVRFEFLFSHVKILWVDSHFRPWVLASSLDRPPKVIS